MKTKLIVLEGFDRVGKDTLLAKLKRQHEGSKDLYVYIQNPSKDMPHYREDPNGFRAFLMKYIDDQINELIDIAKQGYSTIVMTRLLVSDQVYSTLFNREPVVEHFIDKIIQNFEVVNQFYTFQNYQEYLGRLKLIGDDEIEYSENEFNKINQLYVSKLNEAYRQHGMEFVIKGITRDEYL